MAASKSPVAARQVKVCGVTDPDEAAALDALGVDWLGFNFHPASPRRVTPQAAAGMIAGLKHAKPVGVFVDADAAQVRRMAEETGIAYAQLHGRENWTLVQSMPLPVIKAVAHSALEDLAGLRKYLAGGSLGRERLPAHGPDMAMSPDVASPLQYLLIDTQSREAFGGTGQTFDWSLLAENDLTLPSFLAGGLGPHNLEAALRACASIPLVFAVDLNSRVETSPGRKDLSMVEDCLAITRSFRA